jgi:hypothetical protein
MSVIASGGEPVGWAGILIGICLLVQVFRGFGALSELKDQERR